MITPVSRSNHGRRSIVSRTLGGFEFEGNPDEVWCRMALTREEGAAMLADIVAQNERGETDPVARKRRTSIAYNNAHSSVLPRYYFKRLRIEDAEQNMEVWPADMEANMLVPEMSHLIYLNPPNFVGALKSRYLLAAGSSRPGDASAREPFYSSLGPVLLALNPNQPIDELYDDDKIQQVYEFGEVDKHARSAPPHPFVVADRSYRRMMSHNENQSIIISGQSGAGKTETSKHLLKYLTAISARLAQSSEASPTRAVALQATAGLEHRILQSNPILESFGNAATFRNYNSSRFGKLINLLFNKKGVIDQCAIDTCLLAKSRVVAKPDGEQNYHILHLLADHLKSLAFSYRGDEPIFEDPMHDVYLMEKEAWGEDFEHVWGRGSDGFHTTAGCPEIVTPYTFEQVRYAFEQMHVGEEDQKIIFRLLLAILYLGNIEFESDEAEFVTVPPASKAFINRVEELLCVPPGVSFEELFTTRTLSVGKDVIKKNLSKSVADNEKKKLIMNLYEVLFKVVVKLTNYSLATKPDSEGSPVTEDFTDPDLIKSRGLCKISLLDIYGFEDMNPEGANGFEQLCINYANEVLHDIFRKQFLSDEVALYKAEGIVADVRETPSENAGLFSAFCSRQGIWTLLNQQSEVTTTRLSSHVTSNPDLIFRETVYGKTAKEFPNVILASKRHCPSQLTVNHYSGDVSYEVEGFVERNQDVFLSKEVAEILTKKCLKPFRSTKVVDTLTHILAKHQGTCVDIPRGQAAVTKFKSNASLFLNQLAKLRAELDATNKWFIRCIKPNRLQFPNTFDDELIAEQLISGGLLQVLDIMKNGYPCRIQYRALYERCRPYLKGVEIVPKDFAYLVQKHFQIPEDDYQLGRTQIFLRLRGWKYFERIQSMNEEEIQAFSYSIAQLQAARTIALIIMARRNQMSSRITNAIRRHRSRTALLYVRRYVIHTLLPAKKLTKVQSYITRINLKEQEYAWNKLYQHYCDEMLKVEKRRALAMREEANRLREAAAAEMARAETELEEARKRRVEAEDKTDELTKEATEKENDGAAAKLTKKEDELLAREEALLQRENSVEQMESTLRIKLVEMEREREQYSTLRTSNEESSCGVTNPEESVLEERSALSPLIEGEEGVPDDTSEVPLEEVPVSDTAMEMSSEEPEKENNMTPARRMAQDDPDADLLHKIRRSSDAHLRPRPPTDEDRDLVETLNECYEGLPARRGAPRSPGGKSPHNAMRSPPSQTHTHNAMRSPHATRSPGGIQSPFRRTVQQEKRLEAKRVKATHAPLQHPLGYHTSHRAKMRHHKSESSDQPQPQNSIAMRTPDRGHSANHPSTTTPLREGGEDRKRHASSPAGPAAKKLKQL